MRQRGRPDERPLYRVVADDIRAAIANGTLQPGQLLPPERALAERYNVSLVAARQGLAVLRGEGLIVTLRGKGSRVRVPPGEVVLECGPHAKIRTRMPTPDEREALGAEEGRVIPEGVPVFEVDRDGEIVLLPGDRYVVETVEGESGSSDR
jgi:DNA-binding transcriptional regulator YhcF (GntR family)